MENKRLDIFIGYLVNGIIWQSEPANRGSKKKGKVKKMNIEKLEGTLNEQVEAGILTQFELQRIMARATGGVYLNDEQKEQYAIAEQYINTTLEVLNKLQIVSAKRMDSTRRKLKLAVSKHIVNDGELTSDGQPIVSNLEFWGEE